MIAASRGLPTNSDSIAPAALCSTRCSIINEKDASAKRPSHFQKRSPWLAVWQSSGKQFGLRRWKLMTSEFSLRHNFKRRPTFRTAICGSSEIVTTRKANRDSKLNQLLA